MLDGIYEHLDTVMTLILVLDLKFESCDRLLDVKDLLIPCQRVVLTRSALPTTLPFFRGSKNCNKGQISARSQRLLTAECLMAVNLQSTFNEGLDEELKSL